jgi:hypothetical protein
VPFVLITCWIVRDAFVCFVVVMHIIQRVICYPMVVAQFAGNKITGK